MLSKSMPETLNDLRVFFNKRETPALHVGYLLGKPRNAPVFGSMRVTPYDKRFNLIAVAAVPRQPNVIKTINFVCETTPINFTDLIEAYGPYTAVYEEKPNATRIVWDKFEEGETIECVFVVMEGFKLENATGGLLLHQPGGGTVVVPEAELRFPGFTYLFKEFDRPEDKRNRNPVIGR